MPFRLTEGRYFGDTVSSRDLSFFTCSITRYAGFEDIKKHYHDNSYVSLLFSGHYTETAGTAGDLVQAGQVIYRPLGYQHANHFQASGGACFNIEFRQGFEEYTGFPSRLPGKVHIYQPGAFPSLYKLLWCFCSGMDDSLLQELVLSWLQDISRAPMPLSGLPWISKVINILDNEPAMHHTIHSLAQRVFVHPVYLSRAFKEKTGLTPGEYQLRGRLQKAMQLLLGSTLPITEIAYTTGFFDPAHMVRSFRLFYGGPPGQFRQALKS